MLVSGAREYLNLTGVILVREERGGSPPTPQKEWVSEP